MTGEIGQLALTLAFALSAVMAIAGALARKKIVPAGAGTLPTHTPLFVGLLVCVVLIMGALTFIPALAVQTRNGQTFVWTVKDDAKGGLLAEQRAVQIGPIQGQSYPVLKGLALGERVVVSGLQKLRPGAHVVAAPPAAKEH